MKKGKIKKGLAVGILILLFGAGVVPSIYGSSVKKNKFENNIHPGDNGIDDEETKLNSYAFVLNQPNNNEGCPDSENIIYEIQMTEEESIQFMEKIDAINQKLSSVRDPDELLNLGKQKLSILRDYNILPSEFTIDNINNLSEEIGNGLLKSSSNFSLNRVWGTPYIAPLPSVFSYICFLGTTKPWGYSDNGFVASPIIKLSRIHITLNYTGIFINSTGPWPIIKNQSLIITNSIWQSIWTILGGNANYTEMHMIGFYYAELLVGHGFSIGFAAPNYMDPQSTTRKFAGSFYYMGGVTFPISFTLYQTVPTPWTALLDVGIIFSLFSVIFPFWIPEVS